MHNILDRNQKNNMQSEEEHELLATSNAVKSNLKDSNRLVRWLNERDQKKNAWIIKLNDDDKWEYVLEFKIKMKFKSMTKIGDYTNKKGGVSKAHFIGSTYFGSVRKKGAKPIVCYEWDVPSRKDWTIRNGLFVKISV